MNGDEGPLELLPLDRPDRPRRWLAGLGSRDRTYAAALRAELILLREENTRLRDEVAQSQGSPTVADELLALSGQRPPDKTDDVAAQTQMMRDVIADVCSELGRTTITLHTRLLGLETGRSARCPGDNEPTDE